MKRIKYHLAEDTIDNRDVDKLAAWLKTYPRLTKGALTSEFEKGWSKWLGTKYSVFNNSGSSANLLMYYALLLSGRLKNKKVIVPSVGWVTSIAPAIQFGFTPIMCEADSETYGLDLTHLEKLLKKHKPGAVMMVQVLGVPHKMDEMLALQKKYGFFLMEDACAAIGAFYKGQAVGTFGDMASFSFYFGHQFSTIEGGMVSTDEAVALSKDKPTVAVIAPQDKSPQILLWDPASHTGKTIAEVAKEVDKVQYFSGGSYMDFFLATGVVTKAQADGSYQGGFDTFVANPKKTMQQGFATAEPYQLENNVAQWKKPVAFQLIHDTGWNLYPEAWAMRPELLAKPETKACLKKLVPILQQGQIDIIKDPTAAVKAIIDANTTYDTFWKYDDGVAKYSIAKQKELGIVGNGTGAGLGSFDMARVDSFIAKATPIFVSTGKTPKAGLKASDIVTNEFINPNIKL